MKTFEYTGFDHSGQPARGLIEAIDIKDAREKLTHRGVLPRKVTIAGDRARRWLADRRRFDQSGRAVFYRELSYLLKAGLPLTSALDVLIQSPEMGADRSVLAVVRDQIRDGDSFSETLAANSRKVTPFEQAAINVGERAGNLDDILERLAAFLEEQLLVQERVATAMIYPVIVCALAMVVGTVILGILLPSFHELLEEVRLPLPAITRWTIAGGRFVSLMAIPSLIIVGVLVWWGRKHLDRSETARVRLNRWVMRVPLIGQANRALVNLRFSRTLALLLRGGVPLIEALPLSGRATGSPWVEQLAQRETESVRHGETLADAVGRIPPLSGSLPGWIRAGEMGGQLPELLESAGQRYQQVWDRIIARCVAVFEPLLVLIVGSLILVLSLAILLPILSLNKALM